ncbi:hypothetical protein V8F20_008073 [Naviculisporaceae sp. PSN 640]
MPFSFRHIPALIQATTTTIGGIWPIFNARGAMLEFGFPPRIADDPLTWPVMIQGQSRTTILGLLTFIFYFTGRLREVDIILAIMGFYAGMLDSWVVWKTTGGLRWTVFRLVASWVLGAWGLMGMTAGRS